MVSLIQTTVGTVLGPLVGQLDAQRQTIERQAEQLASQAETIGELRAQLAAGRSESPLVASGATAPPDLTPGGAVLDPVATRMDRRSSHGVGNRRCGRAAGVAALAEQVAEPPEVVHQVTPTLGAPDGVAAPGALRVVQVVEVGQHDADGGLAR